MDLLCHPDPILLLIISFLPFCSVCKLIQTCKRFERICKQDNVVKKKRDIVVDNLKFTGWAFCCVASRNAFVKRTADCHIRDAL